MEAACNRCGDDRLGEARISLTRAQTVELGGNAVLAADIDYAEVGGQRAMLMVCMTGTAVRLINTDQISAEFGSRTQEATRQARRIRQIEAALSNLN